jgi:phosphatidylglycerophosphatase A
VNWKLWIAQGFGIGRIPVAPGTFGSIVGIGYVALLLLARSWPVLIGGIVIGAALSVWLCGEAEKILGQKDPGSVVIDEIIAIPLCFVAWLNSCGWHLPGPAFLFEGRHWINTVGIFLLFRVFDVWKPWPVRQSQSLPGGWGVTVDDLLAAVYVNLLTIAVAYLIGHF